MDRPPPEYEDRPSVSVSDLRAGHRSTRASENTPLLPLSFVKPRSPGNDDCGYRHLPVELFKNRHRAYAFDARNVAFLELDPSAYRVLKILREQPASEQELKHRLSRMRPAVLRKVLRDISALQSQGYFVPYEFQRALRHNAGTIRKKLTERMAGMTVFVTTQCNLECSYCIYGGQYERHDALTQTIMPWETLRAAMDFLERHSRRSREIAVHFFGGEPLLAFPLIERAVRYVKASVAGDGRQVTVTIASNGTVLNRRILDFLIEHDVYLQFSVDGGRDAHDRHRRFHTTGKGSHDAIMRNLERIHAHNGRYYRHNMRLKAVLSSDAVDASDDAFFANPLVQSIVREEHFSLLDCEPHYELSRDTDYFAKLHRLGRKLLRLRHVRTLDDLQSRLGLKQRALYQTTFGRFFEIQVTNAAYFGAASSVPFKKGCMPGYAEGAVTPNGDISICLKSAKGDGFVIGNVIRGEWYHDRIHRLNTRLHEKWAGCRSCFVQKFCDLCYEKLDSREDRWDASRDAFCEFNRERHRVIFGYMLRVMDNNPQLWCHSPSPSPPNRSSRRKPWQYEQSAPRKSRSLADAPSSPLAPRY